MTEAQCILHHSSLFTSKQATNISLCEHYILKYLSRSCVRSTMLFEQRGVEGGVSNNRGGATEAFVGWHMSTH